MTDSIESYSQPAEVHGRYLLRRAAGDAGAPLLVGFHGYGENAERLLEAIVEIPHISSWNLAVIQALHPFYNSKTGEVVASWMTKLDREQTIADNLLYVDRALDAIKVTLGERLAPGAPMAYLGFSQGTAMAYRAAVGTNHNPDGLIALAGDLPSDVSADSAPAIRRVLIGRGDRDTWYDAAKLESDVARLQSAGCEVTTCVFEGGHEWAAEFLAASRDFLNRLFEA